MLRVIFLALAVVSAAGAGTARADESTTAATSLRTAVTKAATETPLQLPAWAADRVDRRPAMLPALYGTYAALQTLDIYSTRRALAAGAAEANPLLRSGGTSSTMVIKGAAGAATIFFAERAWKKNRAGAIVLMAILNGTTAAIVAHNAHNAHNARR